MRRFGFMYNAVFLSCHTNSAHMFIHLPFNWKTKFHFSFTTSSVLPWLLSNCVAYFLYRNWWLEFPRCHIQFHVNTFLQKIFNQSDSSTKYILFQIECSRFEAQYRLILVLFHWNVWALQTSFFMFVSNKCYVVISNTT